MNTQDVALSGIPDGLRKELIVEYNKLIKNFRERRWEPAELDGARLCEVIYSIINGLISGSFPSKASKPKDFQGACKELANVEQNNQRKIYYCETHSPWQKGSNENMNGRLRWYLPKKLIFIFDCLNA